MAMKRGQLKPVLMELKALFKKNAALSRSCMRQKTKTGRNESCKFEYSDFAICGLFEKENRLLYGDFLELGFERGAKFVGEYQWRLTAES